MIRIIARNSAPISRNRPAAQTKERIRNRTEWTGFLAMMTAKADTTSTGAKIQKNRASACIARLSSKALAPTLALCGQRVGAKRRTRRVPIAARTPRPAGDRALADNVRHSVSDGQHPSSAKKKAAIDTARRARCCAPTPAPSDRHWPATAACRSKALRASRSQIRNSALRRSRRPDRLPGTCRSRCT